jgi:hypothetical protein
MLPQGEREIVYKKPFQCPRCGTQLQGVDDLFVNFNNTLREVFTGLEHTLDRCTVYWSATSAFRRTYSPDDQRDKPPELG